MHSFKEMNEMDKKDKIRATHQHACLCYVSNEKMTNQSLRKRFQIAEKIIHWLHELLETHWNPK